MPDGTDVREERPAERLRREPEVARSRPWLGLSAVAIASIALGLVIWHGIDGRREAEAALAVSTRELAVPVVTVVSPDTRAPDQDLVLPGNTVAFINAPIYARTSGYLKRWYFDIGAHVRQGQLLAEIETPELDEQLRQARADWSAAQANPGSPHVDRQAHRCAREVRNGSSAQDGDTADSALSARKALERSREAEVTRLERLTASSGWYAPFDGIITARNTDVGPSSMPARAARRPSCSTWR